NPTCRRILLLFGESFRHSKLNTATHDAMHEWFGTTSIPALAHLAMILRIGHVVDRDGVNAYMPHLERLALPISFIHGRANREFLPNSPPKPRARGSSFSAKKMEGSCTAGARSRATATWTASSAGGPRSTSSRSSSKSWRRARSAVNRDRAFDEEVLRGGLVLAGDVGHPDGEDLEDPVGPDVKAQEVLEVLEAQRREGLIGMRGEQIGREQERDHHHE